METRKNRRVLVRVIRPIELAAFAIIVTGLVGCPSAAPPSSIRFSETEIVPIAGGTGLEAALGAGAPSLADSTWSIHKASDDTLLFRMVFGSDGEVERLFDSFVFASEWLGSDVITDAKSHPTAFAGGTYLCGAYAAEDGENVGVLGILHGVFLGAHLGTATLSFSGAIDGDRIDGVMVRTVKTFAETPFSAPGDAEFDAYALRER